MSFEYQTPLLVLSNIILLVFFFFIMRTTLYDENFNNKNTRIGVACVFLFCIFSFWGSDWFHYQTIFNQIKNYPSSKTHLESIYQILIPLCPHYLIFRILIWGSALLLFYKTIQLLELKESISWFVFGIMFMLYFSYARVSLSIAIIIYGISIIYRPDKMQYKYSTLVGYLIVLCSMFFHKSAIIGVAIAIFSSFIRVTNKNSWLYILLSYVVLVFAIQFLLVNFSSLSIDQDDSVLNASQSYISKSVGGGITAVGTIILSSIEKCSYFLMAFLCYGLQNEYELPKHIEIIVKINLYLVLTACIFIFDFGYNTSIFYGRILRFTLIPSTIVMTYAIQYDLFPRMVKLIYGVSVFVSFVALLYSFYCTIA